MYDQHGEVGCGTGNSCYWRAAFFKILWEQQGFVSDSGNVMWPPRCVVPSLREHPLFTLHPHTQTPTSTPALYCTYIIHTRKRIARRNSGNMHTSAKRSTISKMTYNSFPRFLHYIRHVEIRMWRRSLPSWHPLPSCVGFSSPACLPCLQATFHTSNSYRSSISRQHDCWPLIMNRRILQMPPNKRARAESPSNDPAIQGLPVFTRTQQRNNRFATDTIRHKQTLLTSTLDVGIIPKTTVPPRLRYDAPRPDALHAIPVRSAFLSAITGRTFRMTHFPPFLSPFSLLENGNKTGR